MDEEKTQPRVQEEGRNDGTTGQERGDGGRRRKHKNNLGHLKRFSARCRRGGKRRERKGRGAGRRDCLERLRKHFADL